MMWAAEFVEMPSGKIPFEEFLSDLDTETIIDIIAAIDEVLDMKNNDLTIPLSKAKHLRNGIFELRLFHKNISTRNLYFFVKDKRIVFTHGFVKKTNRTPKNEIERAEKLRNIYLNSNEFKK